MRTFSPLVYRIMLCTAAAAVVSCCASSAWAVEKWESLLEKVETESDGIEGKWTKSGGALSVNAVQRGRLMLPFAPAGEYDFRVTFTRRTGAHSIALIFPHGDGQAAFEIDAWGQHLAGIQNVSGRDIRDNATRRSNMPLTNGTRYTMTLEVRAKEIRALLDDRLVATLQSDGSDLSLSDLWELPNRQCLGLGAWESETTFHRVEARLVNGKPLPFARATTSPASTPVAANTATTRPVPAPAVPAPAAVASTRPGGAAGTGRTARKRVLIVIANHHFFYREYGDPRAELERAGIQVTVAAGRKAPCHPHAGSGQGPDGGGVQPDLALADVKAEDYDAILFSGGWGASAYQFAFDGRYNDPAYNGERLIKTTTNDLIGSFVKQDKYVCALCNGVSVLAWARVKGRSPLNGKRVCAPTREAPAGIYNGRPGQPSCRWHPESNGAILSPAGSIGRPGTAEDDVLVDGKIVTGEDDISAREMGRRIVQLLTQK